MLAPAPTVNNWQAALDLRFEARRGRSVLARREHYGPLAVQNVLYPEGDAAHVLILHPPGGMVGGDHLRVQLECATGAVALVTTPASGKVYRSNGQPAYQDLACLVAANASLEWLPQDTIVYSASDYQSTSTIWLQPGSRFVGREVITLGRQAHGDLYANGRFDQCLKVFLDGELLLSERLCWRAPSGFMHAPWGLAGRKVCGAMLAYPADEAVLECVRAVPPGKLLVGASLPGGLLSLRCLGDDANEVRDYLDRAWSALRPAVIGRAPCSPRIWRT